jgi:hypothetical protein
MRGEKGEEEGREEAEKGQVEMMNTLCRSAFLRLAGFCW